MRDDGSFEFASFTKRSDIEAEINSIRLVNLSLNEVVKEIRKLLRIDDNDCNVQTAEELENFNDLLNLALRTTLEDIEIRISINFTETS